MSIAGKAVYYGLQRIRAGVTPGMVRLASDVLDRPWSRVLTYVDERLEENYDLHDRKGRRWLAKQPITTKNDYRNLTAESGGLLPTGRGQRRRTSGSSGKPFEFRRDKSMTAWMDAAMWAVYGWHGIEPGDRMARFWGRPLAGTDAIRRKLTDAVLCQRRLNAFDVSPERSRAFFEELLAWNPKYAYGYPTLIREFVQHLRADDTTGEKLGLDVVITTGEMLDESTRVALESFFACTVVNEYGCSESGILAFECQAGRSHLIPVAAYTEVEQADPSHNRAAEGRTVVTDLYGEVMPFIRYSLDDAVRVHPADECQCGRELPRLDVLAGRSDGLIRMPDGHKVYDAVLAYTVPAGVTHFQVRQTALDKLEGRVTIGEEFRAENVVEECRARWCEALDGQLQVEVEAVDHIDRSDSGKHRYFVPLEDPSMSSDGERSISDIAEHGESE